MPRAIKASVRPHLPTLSSILEIAVLVHQRVRAMSKDEYIAWTAQIEILEEEYKQGGIFRAHA
jgi:hypothetical protein